MVKLFEGCRYDCGVVESLDGLLVDQLVCCEDIRGNALLSIRCHLRSVTRIRVDVCE